ncbi:MAG: Tex family protein [Lachnospiraceae bacterium]
MDIVSMIARELNVKVWQVRAAVQLLDEGNTIPFVARYRKEATGALDDEQLRKLGERLTYLRNLEEKKAQILERIEGLGMLTDELRQAIVSAETQVVVDDLYRPYRPKRRTRATAAREKGLGPLADALMEQRSGLSAAELAASFVDEDKGVPTAEDAIAGARDILAEMIADEPDYRRVLREQTLNKGNIVSQLKSEEARELDERSVYEMYYDFEEPLMRLLGYRVLAINRGEAENILKVSIGAPDKELIRYLEKQVITGREESVTAVLREAVADSYARLLAPAVERELRSQMTERAQESAIQVFGKNLEQLLMQPPISGQTVLGWDPAFRTGCKLAVVDSTGKVLDTAVIYPTKPQGKVEEAKDCLKKLIKKYGITLISLGNGTASRESEEIIAQLLREITEPVSYVIVSEAGASVYSASKLASEEFPQLDVGLRSAASIARRLQDPLAELVKIDPKAIGVGQYQHDMNQKRLEEALKGVVETCVNRVGVDLNTASPSLLSYVAGITGTVAKNIVSYREQIGHFDNRRQLLKVPKLGPKAFEQCAGFLRIMGGSEPLDATAVHPESYHCVKTLLQRLHYSEEHLKTGGFAGIARAVRDRAVTAKDIGIGEMTLSDILKELEKPGRDPRAEMPKPVLRTDVLDIKDLHAGMALRGTVRNVIDFGVFVDIGVHQDGLVHISKLTNERFVKHPLEVVQVGDVVEVTVLDVDVQRGRIQLSMLPNLKLKK